MANRTRWTPEKKAAFCDALATCGHVGEAAKTVGLSRSQAFALRQKEPEFAAAWQEAEDLAVERMEREADRRAIEGVEEPVFYQGKECGRIRRYSDTLLIFRLKALRPEKYRERVSTELSGSIGLRHEEWLRKLSEE